MEQRAILAAVLSVIVLMAYLWVQEQYFTPKRPPETKAPQTEIAKAEAPKAPAELTAVPRPAPAEQPKPVSERQTDRPPQRITSVTTPLYRAVVSSDGGKLQEWTLKYRGEKPMVAVGELGPLGLVVSRDGVLSGEPLAMRPSAERLALGPEKPAGELVLLGEVGRLRVKQTLRFHADAYTVDVLLRVENPTDEARTISLALPWVVRRQEPSPEEKFSGQHPTEIVWSTRGTVRRFEDLAAFPELAVAEGEWIGMGSTWYLAAFVPKTPGFTLAVASERASGHAKSAAEGRVAAAARATPSIAPGQAWEGRVVVYIGPKEYDRLQAHGLAGTLNFGGFPFPRQYGGLPMEWLGVPILKLMNWVYGYVGNYGVAIIVLTVLTKVLFYPLTVKSLRSMKAMQALQPQVNALRSKHKSDARKLQEETLALYRRHKVNPMGGCLPMVAQIPIFYALYLALSVSVELQNAPFLCVGRLFGVELWICDLSTYDPTYVLPILMGISMFVQQKMSPQPGDPRQAKMMLLMPVVFTFMFLNLPSGLVLYWSVSNVLQIIQQWFMNRPGSRGATREAKHAARA